MGTRMSLRGIAKLRCGMMSPLLCLTLLVMRPIIAPVVASARSPPLLPWWTSAVDSRRMARSRCLAILLRTPLVHEGPRQADGGNTPCPTTTTSLPSFGIGLQ